SRRCGRPIATREAVVICRCPAPRPATVEDGWSTRIVLLFHGVIYAARDNVRIVRCHIHRHGRREEREKPVMTAAEPRWVRVAREQRVDAAVRNGKELIVWQEAVRSERCDARRYTWGQASSRPHRGD